MKTQEELNRLKKEYKELKSKLLELSEDELKEISGGLNRARTITLTVTLPLNRTATVELTVYIDGLYESTYTNKLDPVLEKINLRVSGTSGHKCVTVKLDNILYKEYDVNFDESSYHEL